MVNLGVPPLYLLLAKNLRETLFTFNCKVNPAAVFESGLLTRVVSLARSRKHSRSRLRLLLF